MQERTKLSCLYLGVGLSLVLSSGCEPKERDLTALLGLTEAGLEREAGAGDEPDAAGLDAALSVPKDADTPPQPAAEAAAPPMNTDAGQSTAPPEQDAAMTTTEPTTEPEDASAPAEDAGETTGPSHVDASPAVDASDSGDNCGAVVIEAVCDDLADDDCDGRIDCEDQDCRAAAECCVAADSVETLCDNAVDDDCDGLSDCEDDDCNVDISCQAPCEAVSDTELDCRDGNDDDCDLLIDCGDADCATQLECLPACLPSGTEEVECEDGLDDDCDGFWDCDDTDCLTAVGCQTACVPVVEDCGDSVDDDCDGFADCLDSTCAPTAGCCVASGPELCDDGVDNDCDGVIDCPLIIDTVPERPPPGRATWEGGATSAVDARLALETPALQDYVVQCRSAKPNVIGSQQFVVCNPDDPRGLNIKPFADSEATNTTLDGLITTQVRFAYPNGQVSQPSGFTYYVHSSLAGAQVCPPKASDQDYFTAAMPALVTGESPRFRDDEALLAAPFVNIEFSPSESAVFDVVAGEGKVEYLSLRRRFSLNPDRSLVLMKRVFISRRAGARACLTAMIRKHDNDSGPFGSVDPDRYFRTGCDAVVMNKQGAGVCLVVDAGGLVGIANPNSSAWQYWNFEIFGWVNWTAADNFMWRKLLSTQQNGELRVFSSKCYDASASGCDGSNPDVLFLPDRALFGW